MSALPLPAGVAPDRFAGPDLRLVDRRAFVAFPPLEVAPGVVVSELLLEIPDVTFPFNVTGGASRYQSRQLRLGALEAHLEGGLFQRAAAGFAETTDVADVQLVFRQGRLEGQGWLRGSNALTAENGGPGGLRPPLGRTGERER